MHLSCTDTNTVFIRKEVTHDPHHLGVPSGASKMISKPMVCLTQTMHRSCVKISTISKRTETSFHLSLVTSGTIRCVQTIFEPMVRLAQTMHLSCIDTNTVSTRKK